MKPLPPIEVLNALYIYDPTTGEVRNRYTRGGARAGDLAGTLDKRGYRACEIRHNGVTYRCYIHRIAYALHHGADPYPMEVDHINRDKIDNRAINLRAVNRRENIDNTETPHKPIRITYPDGRGAIVTDSVSTASRILNMDGRKIHRIAHRNNNQILFPHPTLSNTYIPSGITIEYINK